MITKAKKKKVYDLTADKPVAKFYYQGNHGHPIRRTVLVIEETPSVLIGYEVREGNELRIGNKVFRKIKNFRKDRIAKWGDYSRLTASIKNSNKKPNASTLKRQSILSMLTEGP